MRLNPFKLIRLLYESLKNLYRSTKKRIGKSLRTQLILTFFICTLAAIFTSILLAPLFENANRHAIIDYTTEMESINHRAQYIADSLSNPEEQQQENVSIQERLNLESETTHFKILLVAEDGTVLYKTKQSTETQIDIHGIIRNALDLKIHQDTNDRKEFVSFYPVELEGKKMYLVVSGIPQGEITYVTSGSPMSGIIGFALFLILFYLITKKKMKQLEAMTYGIGEISKGNLQYRITFKSEDEIGILANNINHMAEQLAQKIEEERRAEKTKNELITNVSHDLRTPLTSIMGYLRLLRDKRYETEGQMEEYISIASNKSEQLKRLIEDLFEYTKLTNEGIKLYKQDVCVNELIEQLMEELVPQAEESALSFYKELPEERLFIHADPDQIVRVFENLLGNAIKYSHKPGKITVKTSTKDTSIQVCIENYSDELTSEELDRLFDRFYKHDESRTMAAEGSGLGLAITKSIVELHGGKVWAECEGELIRFLVELPIITNRPIF